MNCKCLIVAILAAALLCLPACVQPPAPSAPVKRGVDISQLPGPGGAIPEYQPPLWPMLQPKTREQSEGEARHEATRGLRPGVAGGERDALKVDTQTYQLARPPLPEPSPVPPEKTPELALPSLQGLQ